MVIHSSEASIMFTNVPVIIRGLIVTQALGFIHFYKLCLYSLDLKQSVDPATMLIIAFTKMSHEHVKNTLVN